MFEVAELGHKIKKTAYAAQVPELRTRLLLAQEALKEAGFPVLVLISGVDGAGKGDVANLLHAWFDPRWLRAYAFGPASDEERERPEYWRYWRALPPQGRIGLYVGSWYSRPIGDRVNKLSDDARLERELARINAFEESLVADGALIVKFWLHLSKDAQRERMQALEKNPATRWRVTDLDRKHLKQYRRFIGVAEHVLRDTSTGDAPWIIIEATDEHYRNLTVGQHLLERISVRLEQSHPAAVPQPHLSPIVTPAVGEAVSVLDRLDLGQQLPRERYKKRLAKYQGRLGELARQARQRKLSTIVVLEGWDAAGKGGLIRRITPALDARNYQIISIAAPTDEERAHHYLWRFWRHIPRGGHVTLYDRSWYGRVLVERVEGYASQAEWMRAYTEINQFEELLCEHGIVLLKFWLHIDPDEQLQRFHEREQTPFKQYKITEDDYRNRDKWPAYDNAVNDMVERTSTAYAPWHLLAANDKNHARVEALRLLTDRLQAALDGGS